MSRSLKKGIYVEPKLLKKVQAMEATGQKKVIRTWARASAIPPEFVGHTFGVHNGKTHVSVFVTEDMVGYKLGEFVPTRKFKAHGGTISKVEAPAASPAPKK